VVPVSVEKDNRRAVRVAGKVQSQPWSRTPCPSHLAAMPTQKVVSTPYKLIDSDPHASRVISYMRSSDLAVWGGATAAAPGALYLWGEHLEISRNSDQKVDHGFLHY
jgi:hypothetical protein